MIHDLADWLTHVVAPATSTWVPADDLAGEAAFKGHWQRQLFRDCAANNRPLWLAAAGGALAPNLSMVFASGYQGAIRYVLPGQQDQGWFALTVSEDAAQPEENPPTKVTRQAGALSIAGTKSWVASSRCVDELIVRGTVAGDPGSNEGEVWFRCPVKTPGVDVTHRDGAGFLPDLSQGFVRFNAVELAATSELPAELFTDFFLAEALMVPVALVGHMLTRWRQQLPYTEPFTKRSVTQEALLQGLSLLELAQSIAAQAPGWPRLLRLHGMHQQLGTLVDLFEAEVIESAGSVGFAVDWRRDRRLTHMYHNGLGKQLAVTLREEG